LLITPQTVSIAAGAALISVVSYRLMLIVMMAVIGACAAWLLARPAAAPIELPDAAQIDVWDAAPTEGPTPREELRR
jgi:hypothetical protein